MTERNGTHGEVSDESMVEKQSISQLSIDELARRNDAVAILRKRVHALEDHLDMYQQLERSRLIEMISTYTDRSADEVADWSLQELRQEVASIHGPGEEEYDDSTTTSDGDYRGFA